MGRHKFLKTIVADEVINNEQIKIESYMKTPFFNSYKLPKIFQELNAFNSNMEYIYLNIFNNNLRKYIEPTNLYIYYYAYRYNSIHGFISELTYILRNVEDFINSYNYMNIELINLSYFKYCGFLKIISRYSKNIINNSTEYEKIKNNFRDITQLIKETPINFDKLLLTIKNEIITLENIRCKIKECINNLILIKVYLNQTRNMVNSEYINISKYINSILTTKKYLKIGKS